MSGAWRSRAWCGTPHGERGVLAIALSLSPGWLAAGSTGPAEAQGQSPGRPAPLVIPGQPYHSYQAVDTLGRTVQFYLSDAEPGRRLPLVPLIAP